MEDLQLREDVTSANTAAAATAPESSAATAGVAAAVDIGVGTPLPPSKSPTRESHNLQAMTKSHQPVGDASTAAASVAAATAAATATASVAAAATAVSGHLVANPLYIPSSSDHSSSSSDDAMSDDDGIVVLGVKKKGDDAPMVVISDSDDDNDTDNDGDSPAKVRRKRNLTELEKTFGQDYRARPELSHQPRLQLAKPKKKSFYKESYASEEDSCSSSSSVEIVEEEDHQLALNVRDSSSSYSRLAIEDVDSEMIYEHEESELLSMSTTTPHKWTRAMESYYNAAVRSYTTADLDSLTSGMDQGAGSWRVDRYAFRAIDLFWRLFFYCYVKHTGIILNLFFSYQSNKGIKVVLCMLLINKGIKVVLCMLLINKGKGCSVYAPYQ